MTADALDSITKIISSPPSQLIAGAALAGIVWKFFERVESVLNEDTKLEIAMWLLGVKTEQTVEHWPETFLVLFDRAFGTVYPSWEGLRKVFLYTVVLYVFLELVASPYFAAIAASLQFPMPASVDWRLLAVGMAISTIVLCAIMTVPDYVSLMFTRHVIGRLHQSRAVIIKVIGLLLVTFWVTYLIVGSLLSMVLYLNNGSWKQASEVTLAYLGRSLSSWRSVLANMMSMLPLFVGGLWLALYGSSGFILRASRRFDLGFQWFNRHADIEKHPLQSIGLVAGAIVAVAPGPWWSLVIL